MTHRRIHKLIWWLLPILALRGMVPVGFMVNLSGGELAMAVCHGIHKPADAATQSESSDKSQQSGTSVCPFTAAGSSATFLGVSIPSIDFAAADDVSADETVGHYLPFGPSRVQQSRAPPALV